MAMTVHAKTTELWVRVLWVLKMIIELVSNSVLWEGKKCNIFLLVLLTIQYTNDITYPGLFSFKIFT